MPHVLSNMSIIVRRRIYEYCHIMYVYHVSYAYLLIFKNYQIFMFLPIWNFFPLRCVCVQHFDSRVCHVIFASVQLFRIFPRENENKQIEILHKCNAFRDRMKLYLVNEYNKSKIHLISIISTYYENNRFVYHDFENFLDISYISWVFKMMYLQIYVHDLKLTPEQRIITQEYLKSLLF